MEEGVLISENNSEKQSETLTASQRLDICKACPLYIKETKVCNPELWMNPKTKQVSRRARGGFSRGCGCLLTRKINNKNSHCHLGLW